jgi:hypothetical protein
MSIISQPRRLKQRNLYAFLPSLLRKLNAPNPAVVRRDNLM